MFWWSKRRRAPEYLEGAGEFNVTSSDVSRGPRIMAWPWFHLTREGAENAVKEIICYKSGDPFVQIIDGQGRVVVEYTRLA